MMNIVRAFMVLFVLVFAASAQAGPYKLYTTPTTGRPTGSSTMADGKTVRWTETDTSGNAPRAIVYQRDADGTVTSLDLGIVAPTATSHAAVALSPSGQYVGLGTTENREPWAYSVKLTASGPLGVVSATRASELPLTYSTSTFGINDAGELAGGSGVTPVVFNLLGEPTELATPIGTGIARGISGDGKTLVGGWYNNSLDIFAAVWKDTALFDMSFGALESEIRGISPDGRYAAGHRDGFATIWDLNLGTFNTFSSLGTFEGCGNSGLCFGPGYDALGASQPILGASTWDKALYANAYLSALGVLLPSPMLNIVGITEKGILMDVGYAASRGVVFDVPNPAAQPVNSVPEPGGMVLLGIGLTGLGAFRRRWRS